METQVVNVTQLKKDLAAKRRKLSETKTALREVVALFGPLPFSWEELAGPDLVRRVYLALK